MRVELQAFDVEHDVVDHVGIYPLTGGDDEGNRYFATAYGATEMPDGTVHLDELETWDVDEDLREAVLPRVFVDESELRLEPLPTTEEVI